MQSCYCLFDLTSFDNISCSTTQHQTTQLVSILIPYRPSTNLYHYTTPHPLCQGELASRLPFARTSRHPHQPKTLPIRSYNRSTIFPQRDIFHPNFTTRRSNIPPSSQQALTSSTTKPNTTSNQPTKPHTSARWSSQLPR